MAILKGVDGTFYEVPDGDLDQYSIPADQVKEKLQDSCGSLPKGPGGGGGGRSGGGLINVHVYGGGGQGAPKGEEVEAFGYGGYCGHWRNCWRNCH